MGSDGGGGSWKLVVEVGLLLDLGGRRSFFDEALLMMVVGGEFMGQEDKVVDDNDIDIDDCAQVIHSDEFSTEDEDDREGAGGSKVKRSREGPFPGQVLTAVGIDPNNGTYPLAYGIVKAESYASWSWFFQNLGEDLDLYVNSNFTFISDRQKGILPAIEKLFPCAEHRFCLRHIHENMKQQWKGKAYKDLIWKCATTTTVPQFQTAMDELKNFNQDCYAWLNQIPPQHWSRSHFTGRCHSDVLLNNMCEVFNKQIVEARDKPIISALEYIRHYLMKRIVHVLKIGRPKKKRKKGVDEKSTEGKSKLRRGGKSVTCAK
ncbi:hypothetical protein L6452_09607 [Arctium lappa]|uniref:Uncharacterized protein n=1 Tax=Arctium lappa TaxID=4217 RepID=A0ACB9DKG0_ARCLA|nr:hypothetical protein L6452_09607 [Arctium lappa]